VNAARRRAARKLVGYRPNGRSALKSKPKLITVLVLAILVIVIIVQNTHNVTFNFLFWSPQISLLLLVVLMVATGFVLGLFASRKSDGS
jgi:uncharacterized integral membrane protein